MQKTQVGTMRAFAIEQFGEPGSVHALPVPQPKDGQVLVRVHVAGVNPWDWKVRDGALPKSTFPLVLGQDFAGVVEQVGAGVTSVAPGDRVFGVAPRAFAEFVVADASGPLIPTPASLDDAHAAALPTAGMTALASLELLGVTANTTLVIVGATGGVGAFAVQIARERGAHVTAVVRSSHQDRALALGAENVIAYDHDDVPAAIAKLHPAGVDAILDVVSGKEALKAIGATLRAGGSLVSTVFAVDQGWFGERGISAHNLNAVTTPQRSADGLRELTRLEKIGALKIQVEDQFPLVDADRVLSLSKAGKLSGKVVLGI